MAFESVDIDRFDRAMIPNRKLGTYTLRQLQSISLQIPSSSIKTFHLMLLFFTLPPTCDRE
jgi:hypothetical protein